jgi:hypothetical protein
VQAEPQEAANVAKRALRKSGAHILVRNSTRNWLPSLKFNSRGFDASKILEFGMKLDLQIIFPMPPFPKEIRSVEF